MRSRFTTDAPPRAWLVGNIKAILGISNSEMSHNIIFIGHLPCNSLLLPVFDKRIRFTEHSLGVYRNWNRSPTVVVAQNPKRVHVGPKISSLSPT